MLLNNVNHMKNCYVLNFVRKSEISFFIFGNYLRNSDIIFGLGKIIMSFKIYVLLLFPSFTSFSVLEKLISGH